MPIIALLTDFGTRDWYVASMKGVILGICPQARIVDITHDIAPGDVRSAAWVLLCTYRDFPPGTIFTAVVDPGVGSTRRGLIGQSGDRWFIGPDNGLFSLCFAQSDPVVRCLENPLYRRDPVSSTFHGRDVFAPAAAHLANGGILDTFGPRVTDWVQLRIPEPKVTDTKVCGEVVYVDRFGNAITNIPASLIESSTRRRRVLSVKGRECPLVDYYQAVAPDDTLVVAGSSGYLEVSANGGSAADTMGLRIGDPVSLE